MARITADDGLGGRSDDEELGGSVEDGAGGEGDDDEEDPLKV